MVGSVLDRCSALAATPTPTVSSAEIAQTSALMQLRVAVSDNPDDRGAVGIGTGDRTVVVREADGRTGVGEDVSVAAVLVSAIRDDEPGSPLVDDEQLKKPSTLKTPAAQATDLARNVFSKFLS